MKLSNAAKHFDDVVATDAHGAASIRVQFLLYDDTRRDGLTVDRRIISVAPAVTIPARRVLTVGSDRWIMGDGANDYFKGEAIRTKYVAHLASGLAELKTIAQALQGQAGATFYAGIAWVKSARQIEVNSELINVETLYSSKTETVQEDQLVFINGKMYFTRQPYTALSGFTALTLDEIEQPLEIISFSSRTYDPITDTYSATTVATTVLRHRWQEHYAYTSKADQSYERGDETVWVLESAAVAKAGDKLTLSDGEWLVLSATDEGAVRSLHVRRA